MLLIGITTTKLWFSTVSIITLGMMRPSLICCLLQDTGELFSHGRNRLYQTHATEDQLLHHFGPYKTYIEELSVGANTFYSLTVPARAVWDVLTTDAVNAAIIATEMRGRKKAKQPNPTLFVASEEEEEAEEDEEEEEE
jgi:hypothetical protein